MNFVQYMPGRFPRAGSPLSLILAVWSPERLALVLTLLLVFITAGVIVLSLQSFDKGIRNGKMPSKARSRLVGLVMGWCLAAVILAGAAWYFDEFLFERVGRLGF